MMIIWFIKCRCLVIFTWLNRIKIVNFSMDQRMVRSACSRSASGIRSPRLMLMISLNSHRISQLHKSFDLMANNFLIVLADLFRIRPIFATRYYDFFFFVIKASASCELRVRSDWRLADGGEEFNCEFKNTLFLIDSQHDDEHRRWSNSENVLLIHVEEHGRWIAVCSRELNLAVRRSCPWSKYLQSFTLYITLHRFSLTVSQQPAGTARSRCFA